MTRDQKYIYIRKSILIKLLQEGISLNKMGKKLNISPNTVLAKLKYHKLMGQDEDFKDLYPRLGIKKQYHPEVDKHKKEVLEYFKTYCYFNSKAPQMDKIDPALIKKFQAIMDASGLLQPPVLQWKIRALIKEIRGAHSPEMGECSEEEDQLQEEKKLQKLITSEKEEIKNHKLRTLRRGPKVWSLVKYILKNYPEDKINFSKMSQNFGGIYPQKIKDILEHHNIDPYNIELYKKEVIATIKIACHEVKIQKRGQRENVKKLANRLHFSNESDFIKMCEVLEIDWKQIYVDEMKIKLDYFNEKGYKTKEICKELNIKEIDLKKLVNKVK